MAVGGRNLLDGNHDEGGTVFLNDAEVPPRVYAEMRRRFRETSEARSRWGRA